MEFKEILAEAKRIAGVFLTPENIAVLKANNFDTSLRHWTKMALDQIEQARPHKTMYMSDADVIRNVEDKLEGLVRFLQRVP